MVLPFPPGSLDATDPGRQAAIDIPRQAHYRPYARRPGESGVEAVTIRNLAAVAHASRFDIHRGRPLLVQPDDVP